MKPQGFSKSLVFLISLSLLLLPAQVPSVHAVGTLFADPPSIVPQDLNTTFDVAVRVAGMDQFNAWDIQVSTNQSVVSPLKFNLTGSIFGPNAFEVLHCVNGRGGSNCSQPGEGPGIVHSAATIFSTTTGGDGLLFTIHYKVVGLGYSNIHLYNDQIVHGGATPPLVAHTTVDSVYGTPGISSDFLISSMQTNLTISRGQSTNSTVQFDSSNGFSGSVILGVAESIGGSTVRVPGLKVSLNSSTVFVSTLASSFVSVAISTTNSTNYPQVTITITGQNGNLSHTVDILLSISLPGDFSISASPGLLLLHASSIGNSTIILQSNKLFSGEVALQVQVIPIVGPPDANATASLSTSSLLVAPGVNSNATLTVKTPFSTLPFHYEILVTGTSRSLSVQPAIVVVRPPSPDFNFTVTPGFLSTHAGSSGTFHIKLVSTDYFQNTVFLYASAVSGTKLSFAPANLTLKGLEVYGHALSATLNVTTDPTLSIGTHLVFLTASASDFRSTVTHSLTVNVTVEQETSLPPPVKTAPKNIFGLDPLVYFAVIGALAVGLAAMTVLEVRRGRRATDTLQERMRSTQISQSAEDPSASKKK